MATYSLSSGATLCCFTLIFVVPRETNNTVIHHVQRTFLNLLLLSGQVFVDPNQFTVQLRSKQSSSFAGDVYPTITQLQP